MESPSPARVSLNSFQAQPLLQNRGMEPIAPADRRTPVGLLQRSRGE